MTVTRFTSEGLPRLDVRVLAQKGALKPGVTTTVSWGTASTIALTMPTDDADSVQLAYDVQTHRNGVTPIRERIRLARTPCTFGGSRVWFWCPGCGARRAVLYALGSWFRCRVCHRVAYASTRQPKRPAAS